MRIDPSDRVWRQPAAPCARRAPSPGKPRSVPACGILRSTPRFPFGFLPAEGPGRGALDSTAFFPRPGPCRSLDGGGSEGRNGGGVVLNVEWGTVWRMALWLAVGFGVGGLATKCQTLCLEIYLRGQAATARRLSVEWAQVSLVGAVRAGWGRDHGGRFVRRGRKVPEGSGRKARATRTPGGSEVRPTGDGARETAVRRCVRGAADRIVYLTLPAGGWLWLGWPLAWQTGMSTPHCLPAVGFGIGGPATKCQTYCLEIYLRLGMADRDVYLTLPAGE